jgi:hypothetical protein
MADIRPGMTICDPACGVGKFLLEPILHDLHRYYKVENGELKPQITLRGFDKGFDKDEQKTIILAKANMLIYMSNMIKENSAITRKFAELFNDTFLLQTNSILGTLAHPTVDEYDLILTNPPYVMSGSSNLKDEINKQEELKQHFSINAMGIEGLFMEWIVRALKLGGKAFVVVPDGIMNRSNDKRLRDFILDECILDAVISLPLNTFFTTNKKTYIMALTKKVPVVVDGITSKARQTTPVFTYLCSEIGETRDVYRFDIEQNDLDTAATLYNMFKGVHGTLPVDDKRCKIVSIDEFYDGSHWSVERWWTREEKIGLGIEEEIETADINQFVSIISDISASITEYQEPLLELEKKKNIQRSLKQVSILDSRVFSLISNGIGYNRTSLSAIDTHSIEDIPVYTAAKAPVAFIGILGNKSPIQASTEHPMLSFATNGDGSAGRNFVVHNRPFYINVDRIAIDVIDTNISLSYLLCQLVDMKVKYGFNHSYKANRHNLTPVNMDIPVNENGDFDLAAQSIIAEQFSLVNQLKSEVRAKHQEINNLTVSIDLSAYTMRNVPLSDLLVPIKGKSKYTRKYGDTHKGEYPVYSASSNTPLTYIDTADYNGSFLSWSTNGFAGTVIVLDEKFSINGDRGILLPKSANVDIQYLKYILEPIFRKLAKGRKGDYGEDEFTKLYPSMIKDVSIPLPVDESGDINILAQQKIAEKYIAIEQYKTVVLEKFDSLITQQITF